MKQPYGRVSNPHLDPHHPRMTHPPNIFGHKSALFHGVDHGVSLLVDNTVTSNEAKLQNVV